MSAFLSLPGRRTLCFDINITRSVDELKDRIEWSQDIRNDEYFIESRGHIVPGEEPITANSIYYVCPRTLGGKGGFGSMLRAIGAQIEKTTNREACRDLSGRRMRDVNNEKQLKDWLGKKADREKEKERKRQERLARRLAVPKHIFEDQQYEIQKSKVAENLEDALQKGLLKSLSEGKGKKASSTVTSEMSLKRKADDQDDAGPSTSKKSLGWMGVEGADLSDLSSDSSESDSDDNGVTSYPRSREDANLQTGSDSSNSNQELGLNDISVEETEKNGYACATKSSLSGNCEGDKKLSKRCGLLSMLPPPVNIDQSDGSLQKEVDQSVTSSQSEQASSEAGKSLDGSESKNINWEECSTAEEMSQLGLEKLKTILMSKGLKCGGTLEQRAERLFSVKGLSPDQINPALLAKPQNGKSEKKKK